MLLNQKLFFFAEALAINTKDFFHDRFFDITSWKEIESIILDEYYPHNGQSKLPLKMKFLKADVLIRMHYIHNERLLLKAIAFLINVIVPQLDRSHNEEWHNVRLMRNAF